MTAHTYPGIVADVELVEGVRAAEDPQDVVDAFQRLIDSSALWVLQGSLVRAGLVLVERGECHFVRGGE